MNAGSTAFILVLQALHLTSAACWMTGQVWMWRRQIAGAANRRLLPVATTLAATLALFSGAGLLAL